jgi:hypothetical protein
VTSWFGELFIEQQLESASQMRRVGSGATGCLDIKRRPLIESRHMPAISSNLRLVLWRSISRNPRVQSRIGQVATLFGLPVVSVWKDRPTFQNTNLLPNRCPLTEDHVIFSCGLKFSPGGSKLEYKDKRLVQTDD